MRPLLNAEFLWSTVVLARLIDDVKCAFNEPFLEVFYAYPSAWRYFKILTWNSSQPEFSSGRILRETEHSYVVRRSVIIRRAGGYATFEWHTVECNLNTSVTIDYMDGRWATKDDD